MCFFDETLSFAEIRERVAAERANGIAEMYLDDLWQAWAWEWASDFLGPDADRREVQVLSLTVMANRNRGLRDAVEEYFAEP